MTHIGTLPLDCELMHGDLTLGTVTLDIPLKASAPHTGDDGQRYVTLSPDFADGWFEHALKGATATVSEESATTATITELTLNQAGSRAVTLLPHAHPMRDALTAYGINPMRTPETVEITETPHGVIIDQYLMDDTGELVLHEGDRGVGVDPVTVKRFFPHPRRGD